ncbi:MAG: hypothetical protein LWW95_07130 [Candidatus Desulfofervidus auxilii]|nr:hypothetical protein [Candidatus Desulfofervidus auxilii]
MITLTAYRINLIFSLFSILFGISGCVYTATVYNLDTGEVIYAKFQNYWTGHGKITATMPDGEKLEGKYSTVSGMNMKSVVAAFPWAQTYSFYFSQPGMQFGTATLTGDKGTVVEIIYVVDPWSSHGWGVGRDNKGNRYRVQF